MNWGQNKFLIGFGVVLLAGCATLGYLLWEAGSQFSDLNGEYLKEAASLKGLQHQPFYPEQSNLEKMEGQKLEAKNAAAAFQAQLAPMAFALVPMSPEQFQDTLRATVSEVAKKAAAAKVKLPEKFYLGFNEYQGKPPTLEAAPALNRELKAIELAVGILIDSKVSAIGAIKRDPLPEEADAAKTPAAAPQPLRGQTGQKGPAAPQPSAPLYSEFPFQIQFSCDQVPFRRALNAFASNRKQFFVVRSLTVKNSMDKSISKDVETTELAPQSAPAPAPGAAGPASSPAPGVMATAAAAIGRPAENLKFIVGTENLNVTLHLNMVVFASAPEK